MKRIGYIFKLSSYIKKYYLKLILSILVHGIYRVLPIITGFETSYIISMVILERVFDIDFHILLVVMLIIMTAIFNYLDIYISHFVAYKILTELRYICYEKVREIAPSGLEDNSSGNIMSIILEDIEILEWFYAHSLIQIFVAVILPVGTLCLLGAFSIYLTCLIIVFIVLLCWIPYKGRKKADIQGKEVQTNLGKLNSIIIDGIKGLKEIITFQFTEKYFEKFFLKNDRYNAAVYDYEKRAGYEIANINFLISISSLITSIFIIFLSKSGYFDKKWILPLISVSTMIYLPLQETLLMSSNYGRIFAGAKRVFEFLNLTSKIKFDGNIELTDNEIKEINCIEVRNMSFSYANKGQKLLTDISFSVKKNESVVIVGESGCGKSTIIKLIQRFYDIDTGEILFNNINIKEMTLNSLRSCISVVPQDVYLFNRTIRDNLKLAKSDASDKEIKRALKKANAFEFVNKMPKGMDTVIGENGVKLSGGEKQRISIAQAFLKDSPVILLDEITANLDYDNERIINDAIEKLKKDKVMIMVAHRLSTIKNADRVIYLNNGVIEEDGSYEEIIKGNNDFRKSVLGRISI